METVTITREQLRVVKLALVMEVMHCKEEAAECARLGMKKAAEGWMVDAELINDVQQQLWEL